ncbi:hypothetical protein T265_09815 [Opisthorchis viverrini]|uniref:Uncharacterized protein n=1 Tax=Opisthorchis viverrini TaxID=6198 RepID=A0A074ZFH1_OPIVI|nr:hypothetical protein T265_09815 [Opisthorchis viverrini]KER21985.1 hypothetical protein T265_09815 [Opisthorchis viverrini]
MFRTSEKYSEEQQQPKACDPSTERATSSNSLTPPTANGEKLTHMRERNQVDKGLWSTCVKS